MTSDTGSSFVDRAAAEIDGLHRLLQAWFRAEGSEDPAAVFAHFDPSFTMITPAGGLITFAQFSSGFPAARGTRPTLIMEISDVSVGYYDEKSALVTYQERQIQADGTTDRRSTALLLNDGTALPKWRHLQETWKA